MSKPNKYQPLTNTPQLIEALLPSTFYADRDLVFRVKMLVENWQRAVKVNQQLEEELHGINTGPQTVAQEVSSLSQGIENQPSLS